MAASDDDDILESLFNNELYNEFMQGFEPTPEDIAKVLSVDELKLLCRRVRCRVDMWKYNPVQDFASEFRKSGRFLGQPQKFINKLLIKAYKQRPHYFKAVEEERVKEAEREWQKRKKEALLRLNQWRYEEQQRLRDSEIETVVAPEYEPIELEMVHDENHINAASVEEQNPNLGNEFEVVINSESMTVDTNSLLISETASEAFNLSANAVSMSASQMLDDLVIPFESESAVQSQDVNYNNFQEFIPLASTQDGIC